jgi:hypothetical protein
MTVMAEASRREIADKRRRERIQGSASGYIYDKYGSIWVRSEHSWKGQS